MKAYIDLHIHTALSPCGDEDMTPNNIVNMAKIKKLDAIAITDHNSLENAASCMDVGKKTDLLVIPGMEVQTKEDVHVVCLFRNLKTALEFQNKVYSSLPDMKNNEEILGKQIIYDSMDNITGISKKLLLTSTSISFDELYYIVTFLKGAFIPAHIDREAYSAVYSLGFLPDYLNIKTVEYNSYERLAKLIKSGAVKDKYNYIKSSDAHYLWDILERVSCIDIDELSADSIIEKLQYKTLDNSNINILH